MIPFYNTYTRDHDILSSILINEYNYIENNYLFVDYIYRNHSSEIKYGDEGPRYCMTYLSHISREQFDKILSLFILQNS